MDKQHSFKLLDGQFHPNEARSVLFALINSKINFHYMESFGITVRTSGDTSFHEKRIEELAQSNVDIKNILMYAEKYNYKLRIDGTIVLKLIDETKTK